MTKMSRKAVLRHLGIDPQEISKELAAFSSAAAVLSSDSPRLIDSYPGQWVGVYHNAVAASAPDQPALMKQLATKGIPPAQTIVRFIDDKPKTFLF